MNNVFIIAEAGVNHNGQLDLALSLCDAAKNAGVDAIKFQTFKTEKIILRDTAKATYQSSNTNFIESQFDMIKALELSFDQFDRIKQYCQKLDLLFLSTPDDEESLDFLVSMGIPVVKIGSGEITNIPFLRAIARKKMKVILSTGMATLGEIESAIYELEKGGAKEISLLHCTTNYPCPMNEVNLAAMITLKNAFQKKVGYSDHTLGVEVSVAAVALGAEIIEKHFTLDTSLEGPDHSASLDPEQLNFLVKSIRNIEQAIGDGKKKPNLSEMKITQSVRRSLVASQIITKGCRLSESNLTAKRAGGKGLSPTFLDTIVGSVAKKDILEDEIILLSGLSFK